LAPRASAPPSTWRGALFGQLTGTELEHVPYRGSAGVATALLSGELPMAFDNFSSVWPLAREGKLRILGVTSTQRSPAAPDVPAVAETVPGFESLSWHGLFAPRPRSSRDRRTAEPGGSRGAAHPRRWRTASATSASRPSAAAPDEFRSFVASETQRWGEVARPRAHPARLMPRPLVLVARRVTPNVAARARAEFDALVADARPGAGSGAGDLRRRAGAGDPDRPEAALRAPATSPPSRRACGSSPTRPPGWTTWTSPR
jgi:hypothetical protein